MNVNYKVLLETIRKSIAEELDACNRKQSAADRRLNEIGRLDDIETYTAEILALLRERAKAKDRALELLPLRDFFRDGWPEVEARLAKWEQHNTLGR